MFTTLLPRSPHCTLARARTGALFRCATSMCSCPSSAVFAHCHLPPPSMRARAFSRPVSRFPQQLNSAHPAESDQQFTARASDMLENVYKGLEDMREANREFDLRLVRGERLSLVLAPSIGAYELLIDGPNQRLVLFSPSSGVFKYRWSARQEAWVHESDEHFLVELLVRELLKHCQGVPRL